MLKITKLTGSAGSGKTQALQAIETALKAEGRRVVFVQGRSTPRGIAQAVASLRPIAPKGWRRHLPAWLSKHHDLATGPVTILIDEGSDELIDCLSYHLDQDAYVIFTGLR